VPRLPKQYTGLPLGFPPESLRRSLSRPLTCSSGYWTNTLWAQAFKAGSPWSKALSRLVKSAGTEVTGRALNRYNAWAAIRKRAKAAGVLTPVGCHTWRATGITIYLENDRRLEHAQQMAGHESPRTTKLYDRTKDEITLSEVERIRL
jgi:integrase